jgi:hypothetical protein
MTRLNAAEITELAKDRKNWKSVIDGINSPSPPIASVIDALGEPAR